MSTKQDARSIAVHVSDTLNPLQFGVVDMAGAGAYNRSGTSCRIAAFISTANGLPAKIGLVKLHKDRGGRWMHAAPQVIQTEIHATLPQELHNIEKYSAWFAERCSGKLHWFLERPSFGRKRLHIAEAEHGVILKAQRPVPGRLRYSHL